MENDLQYKNSPLKNFFRVRLKPFLDKNNYEQLISIKVSTVFIVIQKIYALLMSKFSKNINNETSVIKNFTKVKILIKSTESRKGEREREQLQNQYTNLYIFLYTLTLVFHLQIFCITCTSFFHFL